MSGFIINPHAFGAAPEANFYQDIVDAGLTSGLQFCLDAGAAASYDGSAQKWLDLSGGGQDFFRGATSGATTDDPTFNGVSGDLSATEYFSFDGGDMFRYDGANETWMDAMHKNNALFSFACLIYVTDNNNSKESMIGTNFGANIGVDWLFNTSASNTSLRYQVYGNALALRDTSPNGMLTLEAWNFFGLSIDEASGTGRHWSDTGGEDTFTSTYSSPSASAANSVLELASHGGADKELTNGHRAAMFAFWDGVELSAANFSTLSTAMLARFP